MNKTACGQQGSTRSFGGTVNVQEIIEGEWKKSAKTLSIS
jgi:hypothetical protein